MPPLDTDKGQNAEDEEDLPLAYGGSSFQHPPDKSILQPSLQQDDQTLFDSASIDRSSTSAVTGSTLTGEFVIMVSVLTIVILISNLLQCKS